MKGETKRGFIAPVITDDNYILGSDLSLGRDILQADGNWEKFLPSTERQRINIETYNCTSFATLNCFEILFRKIYGQQPEFSDRFLGIMAGTKPPGNDPHTAAEALRKNGAIPEEMLPYSGDSWQEYYSFKGASEITCRAKGQELLSKYVLGHEYVFKGKLDKDKMREALKYSPLGISAYAWETDAKGQYISKGQNTHWTVCYKIDDKGQVYVFDSYEPYYKVLSPDHEIEFCKRYSITPNTAPVDTYTPILKGIVETLKAILSYFQNHASKTIGKIVGTPTIIKDFTRKESY